MDNALANELQRSLGIQRPQSSEHARELVCALRPELERLRSIAAVVETALGTRDAAATQATLEAIEAAWNAQPQSARLPEIFMHRRVPRR